MVEAVRADLEFAIRLAGADDHVLRASVAAMQNSARYRSEIKSIFD
jgi:hypothetical protein